MQRIIIGRKECPPFYRDHPPIVRCHEVEEKYNSPTNPWALTHVGPCMPYTKGCKCMSATNSLKMGVTSMWADTQSRDHLRLY